MSIEDIRRDLDLRAVGEIFYLRTLDQLTVNVLDGESGLPGWTRKHVAVHMINNAEALMRLLDWATTGVENPMYPSRTVRDAEIEEGVATIEVSDVRGISHEVAVELAAALPEPESPAWDAQVLNGRGEPIMAAAIPWMRAREALLHALDLNIGMTALDFPTAAVDRLLTDVETVWAARAEPANFLLHITDRPDRPELANYLLACGDAAAFSAEPVELTGEAAELVSFLLGRGWPRGQAPAGTSASVPQPPAWL
jgi:maleylpyruvate isomerase